MCASEDLKIILNDINDSSTNAVAALKRLLASPNAGTQLKCLTVS